MKLAPQNKKYLLFGFPCLFSKKYIAFMDPVYAIHFYENDQIGQEISDLYIEANTVNSAREKFKLFEQEMALCREKCTSTKKKSEAQYLQFLKEYEEMKQSHHPQASKKIKEDSLDELVQVPKETLKHIINFVHNLKAKDVSEIVSEN